MNKQEYKNEYNNLKKIVEEKLDEYVPVIYPEEIYKSMKYSLNAGGKRLRPVMVLETCKMVSGSYENAIPTACAIEMLHTQSLIHDDLPCMDNDDYRRGKLTNHKAFSESTAVLAGDALLSFAPKLIIDKTPKSVSAEQILQVIREFCIGAGVDGIISGQIVDMHLLLLSGAAHTAAPIFSYPVSSRVPLNTWLPYLRRISDMLVFPRLHLRPGSSWCQYHFCLF